VLRPEDWNWTGNADGDSFLRSGDVVYVKVTGVEPDGTLEASLEQDSGAQAALMAMDNATGEVVAMVGGRDFALSQFNRATQAQRQVGSSFKPYVYTTAIEAGEKPTDIVLDEPTTFPTPNGPYTPHNYEANYMGPMTLINAFAESRNIPALRLANRYGIRKVIETARRFGVTSDLPAFLPVAIGAADISLYEQVGAYSVFPNDGIRIEPHYIRKVVEADGLPFDQKPAPVNAVISVETARAMMQLLEAVVQHGTGVAASQLKHPLGGKTGTTNNFTDAWFVGFSPSVTCGTWVGYDSRQSLGDKETGARAALPIWMDFMRTAIANKPDEHFAADAKMETMDAGAGGSASAVKAAAAAGVVPKEPPAGEMPKAMPVPVAPVKKPVTAPAKGVTVPVEPVRTTGVSKPADGIE
jgi:penicillin-binding protein 1A